MSIQFPKVGEIFEQKYELLELLGTGGVGVVFKAKQLDAGRYVALKILHPHLAEDESFKQRFLREAKALSLLSHANIVTVYHLGLSESGLLFLAMEHIEGRTLRAVLMEDKQLDPRRAARITLQLCSALSCIHGNGIVHRDLKPENIFLMSVPEPDSVKIIDFGLAFVEPSGSDQKITATGAVLGSVQYMSPEQSMGRKIDSRSDLYSLALCFYEMLAGKPAFEADSAVGILYRQANEDYSLNFQSAGSLSNSNLTRFFKKAFAADPEKRFQSAVELGVALQELIDAGANGSRFTSSKSRTIAITIVVLVFLFGAVAIHILQGHKISRTPGEISVKPRAVLVAVEEDELDDPYKVDRSPRHYFYAPLNKMGKEDMRNELARSSEHTFRRGELLVALAGRLDGQESLKYAEEALSLCEEQQRRTRQWQKLFWQAKLQHIVSLYSAGERESALREAGDFLKAENDKVLLENEILVWQDFLRVQIIAARCLGEMGKRQEALVAMDKMAGYSYGFTRANMIDAFETAVDLRDFAAAKKMVVRIRKGSEAAELAEYTREAGYPELAYEVIATAVARIRDLKSDDPLELLSSDSDPKSAFLLKKELYLYLVYKGKTKEAKKVLHELRQNQLFEKFRHKRRYTKGIESALKSAG